MPIFLVVFTGRYLEGRAPMDVETAMSDALNLSLPQREKIFSGRPIVLKRTSDKAAALSLGQQLKAFGADIRIKIEQAIFPNWPLGSVDSPPTSLSTSEDSG